MSAAADIHGDRWAAGAPHDHAVNVVAGGPPRWLRDRLHAALADGLAAYPDETPAAHALAARHGRSPDEVVLLNGAAHGFALIAATLAPRAPAVVHPQFTEPDRALRAAGHRPHHVVLAPPYALDPERVPAGADLVVVGNPTNPTGVLHPPAVLSALARPGRTLVVDEAFMDFVAGERASLAAAGGEGGGGPIIVLRSLTKILGVPGLRVGYLLAPAPLAARLREGRGAWPVNALALVAARAAAEHPERLAAAARRARADRAALAAALAAIPRVAVHDGAANFVLVELDGARAVARGLRERHGIAVRPAGTFPGLTDRHLRLTARGGADDARLVAAVRAEAGRALVATGAR